MRGRCMGRLGCSTMENLKGFLTKPGGSIQLRPLVAADPDSQADRRAREVEVARRKARSLHFDVDALAMGQQVAD